nr:MAG TPA_asm: hypothetical protein [Caudoviricetes sp.]
MLRYNDCRVPGDIAGSLGSPLFKNKAAESTEINFLAPYYQRRLNTLHHAFNHLSYDCSFYTGLLRYFPYQICFRHSGSYYLLLPGGKNTNLYHYPSHLQPYSRLNIHS